MTSARRKNEPLICDIILNHDFTLVDNAKLTIEFIKFLCVQKGQIPVPCSQLEKLASLAQIELEKTPNQFKPSKERAASSKSRRKQTAFVKKAESFQDNLKDLSRSIISSFEHQSEQVAIILGTSVFNPKEIFVLDWSNYPITHQQQVIDDKKGFLKKQASFFRYLVTAENLFPILQTIRPTKLHVLCQTSSAPVGCIPRLNYKIRGRQVTLRILRQSQILLNPSNHKDFELEPARRRLVFSSPVSTRHYRKNDNSLDLSGFDKLLEDDTENKCNFWFQIQISLTGFPDTFKQDS